jgi:hypothetical protein
MERRKLGMIVNGSELLYSFGNEVGNWSMTWSNEYCFVSQMIKDNSY